MYSKKASIQLNTIIAKRGSDANQVDASLSLRWPYHAKVMNRLEQNSKPTLLTGTGICMKNPWSGRKVDT